MDKIKKYIKRNKKALIIVGVVMLFVLLFISAATSKKYSGTALIEQPLYFYKSQIIEIPTDLAKKTEVFKKGLEIYKIKNENLNIKVENIISKLNILSPQKSSISTIYYQWTNKGGDKVVYDYNNQSLIVTLQDKKNIFPEIAFPSDDQLNTLLPRFVKEYINTNFTYLDLTSEKDGSNYVIKGRRNINGLPLSYPGLEKYYDNIVLDGNLNLISARISLLEYEAVPVDKLDIVKPTVLSKLVSSNQYPKSINQGLPEGYKNNQNEKYVPNADNFAVNIPRVTKSSVNSINYVYYFSNVTQQFLIPVFRLEGSGKAVINGVEYEFPMIIHASAIDPSKVYIPSNIEYAD